MRGGVFAAAATSATPVVWSFFGSPFPAGSMIVGLGACCLLRACVALETTGPKRWVVEGCTTGLALLVTAVWIIEKQIDLFAALGTGAGCGAAGAGLITYFKRRGEDAIAKLDALTGGTKPPSPMIDALKQIDRQDGG